MAQGTMSGGEFDDHVRVIQAMLADLEDLAEEWPTLDIADRATAEYEWSEAMARLDRLCRAAADGRIDHRRQAIVTGLRRHLGDALPVARAIGLRDPGDARLGSAISSTA